MLFHAIFGYNCTQKHVITDTNFKELYGGLSVLDYTVEKNQIIVARVPVPALQCSILLPL